jgi:hypothetical protein
MTSSRPVQVAEAFGLLTAFLAPITYIDEFPLRILGVILLLGGLASVSWGPGSRDNRGNLILGVAMLKWGVLLIVGVTFAMLTLVPMLWSKGPAWIESRAVEALTERQTLGNLGRWKMVAEPQFDGSALRIYLLGYPGHELLARDRTKAVANQDPNMWAGDEIQLVVKQFLGRPVWPLFWIAFCALIVAIVFFVFQFLFAQVWEVRSVIKPTS